MIITVFRAYARENLDPRLLSEVTERNTRMLELASHMPGFISYKEYEATDGEMLAVVEFDTLEHVSAWRNHPEHREVQQWARENIFASYNIQTCEVVRVMRFPG